MISIIVPIYKVEAELRRCVDSVLRQTISDFELILVDDGSPDGCGEICDEYAKSDSRVRVIHKENGGLSDARNAGLRIARGQYIAFVDSDDWLSPRYLEKLLAGLQRENADICECEICRTTGEIPTETVDSARKVMKTVQALAALIQDRELHQHVWNKLYRREVIGDIFFAKGKTNEDEFWTYQIFGRAKKVAKISDVLYYYYQRAGSIMGTGYSVKRLDALEAKVQRQRYIEKYYPELRVMAKINLYFSWVYAGQMVLKYLPKEKEKINAYAKVCALQKDEAAALTGGSKLWYPLLRMNFWLACRLRNLAKIGL